MVKTLRKQWSFDEILGILDAHAKRIPIKSLARQHSTTPNAIQKALQRYKQSTSLEALKRMKPKGSSQDSVLLSRYPAPLSQPEWVDFEDVIAWLRQCNVLIEQTTNSSLITLFPFRVDERYMTRSQILFEAHRQRLRRGHPIFWVYGISREDV